jgi:Arc/MetJ-type ribon-helix-helix transcriptional regulator
MAETEKITINMSIVDLGQIDLLVEQGFYSNRTDFIRTAIRNQLQVHAEPIQQAVVSRTMAMGTVGFNRKDLEKAVAEGRKLEIKVVGLLVLSSDISPELARQAIQSIDVLGVFRAPDLVKAALVDRMKT